MSQPHAGWPSPHPPPPPGACPILGDLSWPHTNPVKEAGQVLDPHFPDGETLLEPLCDFAHRATQGEQAPGLCPQPMVTVTPALPVLPTRTLGL